MFAVFVKRLHDLAKDLHNILEVEIDRDEIEDDSECPKYHESEITE